VIASRDKKITLVNESLQAFFPAAKSHVGRSLLEVLRRHEIEQAVSATLADGSKHDLALVFEFPQSSGAAVQRHFDIHISPMSRTPGNSLKPRFWFFRMSRPSALSKQRAANSWQMCRTNFERLFPSSMAMSRRSLMGPRMIRA
jgi:hypothetical protein